MTTSPDARDLGDLISREAREFYSLSNNLISCGLPGIGEPPPIIVVGQQSSGKSSVLEAISPVRFAVKDEVPTRFPTEVILSQSSTRRVKVSIQFADHGSEPIFERPDLVPSDLPAIIDEAKAHMGVSATGFSAMDFSATGDDYSRRTLRLRVQGPDVQPLTLIDLPGLYLAETANHTPISKAVVEATVREYMKRDDSIMLVVADAPTLPVNQRALQTAKNLDRTGERTIGVITKPDLATHGSEQEAAWLRVVQNVEPTSRLKHGWHVLHICRDKEGTPYDKLFSMSGAWTAVPAEDRGAAALCRKLDKIICERLRKRIPDMLDDIEEKTRANQAELHKLGVSRTTEAEKRNFLLRAAEDYQRVARDGINGWYNDPFFGDLRDGSRKLRAQLRNFNHALDYIMKTKGSSTVRLPDSGRGGMLPIPLSDDLKKFLAAHRYPFDDPEPIPKERMLQDLRDKASRNRGLEFPGTPNQALIIALFQEQAKRWQAIAECHVKLVRKASQDFVEAIFSHVAPGQDAMMVQFVDTFFQEQAKILQEKVAELWDPYRDAVALPLDVNMVDAASRSSLRQPFLNFLTYLHPISDEEGLHKDLDYVEDFLSEQSEDDDEFGLEQIYCMMSAYYENSRRTFTDNVINLAVENCLIRNLPKILTPSKVIGLEKAQLDLLASEPEGLSKRRQQLLDEQETLERGSRQCAKLRRCRTSDVFGTPLPVRGKQSNISTSDEAAASTEPSVSGKPSEG